MDQRRTYPAHHQTPRKALVSLARALEELAQTHAEARGGDFEAMKMRLGEAARGPGGQEFVRLVGGSAEEFERLIASLEPRPNPDEKLGPLLEEMKYCFERLADSLAGSAVPQALAA